MKTGVLNEDTTIYFSKLKDHYCFQMKVGKADKKPNGAGVGEVSEDLWPSITVAEGTKVKVDDRGMLTFENLPMTFFKVKRKGVPEYKASLAGESISLYFPDESDRMTCEECGSENIHRNRYLKYVCEGCGNTWNGVPYPFLMQ